MFHSNKSINNVNVSTTGCTALKLELASWKITYTHTHTHGVYERGLLHTCIEYKEKSWANQRWATTPKNSIFSVKPHSLSHLLRKGIRVKYAILVWAVKQQCSYFEAQLRVADGRHGCKEPGTIPGRPAKIRVS